jgi:hypothetical protein
MIKDAQFKAGVASAIIAAIVGIILSTLTGVIPRYFDRYATLESGLNTLSAKIDVATLKDRLDRLEAAAKSAAAPPGTSLVVPPPSAPASKP